MRTLIATAAILALLSGTAMAQTADPAAAPKKSVEQDSETTGGLDSKNPFMRSNIIRTIGCGFVTAFTLGMAPGCRFNAEETQDAVETENKESPPIASKGPRVTVPQSQFMDIIKKKHPEMTEEQENALNQRLRDARDKQRNESDNDLVVTYQKLLDAGEAVTADIMNHADPQDDNIGEDLGLGGSGGGSGGEKIPPKGDGANVSWGQRNLGDDLGDECDRTSDAYKVRMLAEKSERDRTGTVKKPLAAECAAKGR